MSRTGIADLWNDGVAVLRRPTGPPLRPSRWAWTADAILAFALSVGTVNAALKGSTSLDFGTPVGAGVPTAPLPPPPPLVPPGAVVHQYLAAQPWQLILAVLAAAPLVARRRFPLAAFWVVMVASRLFHRDSDIDPTFTFTACVIAAYSAAMYSPYQVLALASVGVGGVSLVLERQADVPSKPGLLLLVLLVPLGLIANAINTWKQRVQSLEAEHEAATRLAVDRERSRIAQELHDVVTHNVSVMVVQAGAARKVMDAAPEQAREALLAIESGGRAAMTELRHVMGLLTISGDGPDPAGTAVLAPQPGLDQVPTLAARIRDTGVPIELTVTGRPVPLSAGMDLAAYRVVQEALTNTVKHAVGARVKIAIDYGPQAVRVEVADTGGTPAASARSGVGRGLVGLRERLAVYGGTLHAGEYPTGGYRVRAVFPRDPVLPVDPRERDPGEEP